MASRLGEEATDELRRVHFGLLERAAATTRGEVIKNLGDGLMVAYRSAADGVLGAVAMQQAIDRHNRQGRFEPLEVRIGLALGDAVRERGEWFGPPAVEAARLCAKANGGQILLTEVVRALTGTRGGHHFASIGSLELKGLPEAVSVCEVVWEPAPARSSVPFPAALAPRAQSRFVGRAAELERLHAEAKEAFPGSRRVVLVAGEPGIGKTRLAAELAQALHAQSATVLLGRCEEELGAPYKPFVEVLRHLIAHTDAHDLRDWVGHGGPELSRLLPELADRLPELSAPRTLDPETERLLLFETIDRLLVGAARVWPVLVVLDDLHWADKATLLLLRHLARGAPAALLVLGTYRESDLSHAHPLTDTLADLRRDRVAERTVLDGLDDTDTGELIASFRGQQPEPVFARTVRAETEGNPFFVEELLAHIGETEVSTSAGIEDLGIPDSVREVIGRRLARLSASTQRALTMASVVGREFNLELLANVSDTAEDELLDALEQAAAARLIVELPDTAGRFAFSHALVRATLADELSAARRLRLHRDISRALETRYLASRDEQLLPALAFHFGEAAAAGKSTKAAEYGLAAGRRALEQLDWEGATALLERALSVMERHGYSELGVRSDVFMALAEARLESGDVTGYRKAAERAAEDARAARSPERLARAAVLQRQWGFSPGGLADTQRSQLVALCEEALDLLDEDQLALRAQVMSALAGQLADAGESMAALEVSERALRLARQAGDDRSMSIALTNRIDALLGTPEGRLSLIDEAEAIAERTRDISLLRYCTLRRAMALLELGDLAGFNAARKEAERIGTQWRQWAALASSSSYAAMLALIEGRFDEVETLAEQTLKHAHDDVDFFNTYAAQIVRLRSEQGRTQEMRALLEAAVDQNPAMPAFRAALALAYVNLGEMDNASVLFDRLAAGEFRSIPRDNIWTLSLGVLSEICARLGDSNRAMLLYELMSPHAGHLAVGGAGAACLGAVDRYLGMLAATIRDWEGASDHYDAALALETRIGSLPLLARTRTWFARMLIARNEPGDHERARELLRTALATAESLGMAELFAECQTMLDEQSI